MQILVRIFISSSSGTLAGSKQRALFGNRTGDGRDFLPMKDGPLVTAVRDSCHDCAKGQAVQARPALSFSYCAGGGGVLSVPLALLVVPALVDVVPFRASAALALFCALASICSEGVGPLAGDAELTGPLMPVVAVPLMPVVVLLTPPVVVPGIPLGLVPIPPATPAEAPPAVPGAAAPPAPAAAAKAGAAKISAPQTAAARRNLCSDVMKASWI